MAYHKLKVNNVTASGNSGEFHDALTKRNNLVKKKFGSNNIIVAAPHHAPKGQNYIAEDSNNKRDADNNAGYVARNIADHIKGEMVVATRASYADPNKEDGTYHKHTVGASPDVLVEIHGHKGGSTRPTDIEISCGSPKYSEHSEKLAEKVKKYIAKIAKGMESEDPDMAAKLRNVSVNGNYDELVLKANKTKSIKDARDAGIMPYHIELAPHLRKSDDGTQKSIPKLGTYVSQAIAAAIADVHQDKVDKKSTKLTDLLK